MRATYGRYVTILAISVRREADAGPQPGHDRREWCRRHTAALWAPHAAITVATGSSVRSLRGPLTVRTSPVCTPPVNDHHSPGGGHADVAAATASPLLGGSVGSRG